MNIYKIVGLMNHINPVFWYDSRIDALKENNKIVYECFNQTLDMYWHSTYEAIQWDKTIESILIQYDNDYRLKLTENLIYSV